MMVALLYFESLLHARVIGRASRRGVRTGCSLGTACRAFEDGGDFGADFYRARFEDIAEPFYHEGIEES